MELLSEEEVAVREGVAGLAVAVRRSVEVASCLVVGASSVEAEVGHWVAEAEVGRILDSRPTSMVHPNRLLLEEEAVAVSNPLLVT